MAAVKKKTKRVSAKDFRGKKSKDLSPKWAGCEEWNELEFGRFFQKAMQYYRLDVANKDLKEILVKWMTQADYDKQSIRAVKACADHRINSTIAGIAGCLLNGMPESREDFNGGRNSGDWLRSRVSELVDGYVEEKQEEIAPAANVRQPSVQDRLRETAAQMAADIEDIYESFQTDPSSFNPKAVKVVNLLKGKLAKAAHARVIRDFYQRDIDEIRAAIEGKDEDLKEAYSHLTKPQLKKFLDFLLEVDGACEMLIQEGKVARKPRAKKAKPVEKVVEKLKFKKADEPLKLVSINPADIVGASELWVYNIKTRKIGRYVAEEFSTLGVKGTSITGFSESLSIQKTLRKPQEQLAEFKSAGKVALRKYLDGIKAVDIKLNGRINPDTILLKVSK